MERKSVIIVRWKAKGTGKKDKWEAYGSLTAFCATHRQYETHRIYRHWEDRTFQDFLMELRRVPLKLNPYKTRKGNLKRAKPGPKRRPVKRPQ